MDSPVFSHIVLNPFSHCTEFLYSPLCPAYVSRLSERCLRTLWRLWITTMQRQRRLEDSPTLRAVWPVLQRISSSSAWRHAMRRSDPAISNRIFILAFKGRKECVAFHGLVFLLGVEEDCKVHSGAKWENLRPQRPAHHRSHWKGNARCILPLCLWVYLQYGLYAVWATLYSETFFPNHLHQIEISIYEDRGSSGSSSGSSSVSGSTARWLGASRWPRPPDHSKVCTMIPLLFQYFTHTSLSSHRGFISFVFFLTVTCLMC